MLGSPKSAVLVAQEAVGLLFCRMQEFSASRCPRARAHPRNVLPCSVLCWATVRPCSLLSPTPMHPVLSCPERGTRKGLGAAQYRIPQGGWDQSWLKPPALCHPLRPTLCITALTACHHPSPSAHTPTPAPTPATLLLFQRMPPAPDLST